MIPDAPAADNANDVEIDGIHDTETYMCRLVMLLPFMFPLLRCCSSINDPITVAAETKATHVLQRRAQALLLRGAGSAARRRCRHAEETVRCKIC